MTWKHLARRWQRFSYWLLLAGPWNFWRKIIFLTLLDYPDIDFFPMKSLFLVNGNTLSLLVPYIYTIIFVLVTFTSLANNIWSCYVHKFGKKYLEQKQSLNCELVQVGLLLRARVWQKIFDLVMCTSLANNIWSCYVDKPGKKYLVLLRARACQKIFGLGTCTSLARNIWN